MIGRPGSQALTPRDIDPMLCTHLIYAYAGLDDDDKIIPILDKEKGKVNESLFNNITSFTNTKPINYGFESLKFLHMPIFWVRPEPIVLNISCFSQKMLYFLVISYIFNVII